MKKLILIAFVLLCTLNAKDIYTTFSVEAIKSANLAFNSSGIVKSVSVEIGSIVKQGDTLARLDHAETQARLNVSNIASKYATTDYERQKKIRKLIDKEKFDKYSYKYENAKAAVIVAQVALDKTNLKAPFDGIIISKKVEIGDLVSQQSGKTLFKIQSVSDAKLVLKFDSKYWNDVHVGNVFQYKLDGDDTKYEEKITKVYPTIDQKTRTMSAEVLVKNIPVGLFGTGLIITEQ